MERKLITVPNAPRDVESLSQFQSAVLYRLALSMRLFPPLAPGFRESKEERAFMLRTPAENALFIAGALARYDAALIPHEV